MAKRTKKKEEPATPPLVILKCSFCDLPQNEVNKLIARDPVYICDQCVDICVMIIAEDRIRERGERFVTTEEIEKRRERISSEAR